MGIFESFEVAGRLIVLISEEIFLSYNLMVGGARAHAFFRATE